MTDRPLSERIREAANVASDLASNEQRLPEFRIAEWRHAETLGFLAEIADQQQAIVALLQARKDTK